MPMKLEWDETLGGERAEEVDWRKQFLQEKISFFMREL